MWSVQRIRGQQSVNSMRPAGGLWESLDLCFRDSDGAGQSDKIWNDVMS